MTVLSIENIERHSKDTILFPVFSLKVDEEEITAIHSTLNVRNTLLNMFIGKTPISSGEIRVNGNKLSEGKQAYLCEIGFFFFDEGLYERLTVNDHFKFYKRLYASNQTFDQVLSITQLGQKRNTRIRNLTYSEKRRVHFARLLFQNPTLFIFEEADLNVDVETKRVFINITQKLKTERKAIVVLTGNMESAVTIATNIYRLDEDGLHKIEIDKENTKEETDELDVVEKREGKRVQFNKIPTKVNDKILLFDPPEIDYIESSEGQSNIYIKGEAFPSVFTLNDLEKRLEYYGFFRCHRSYIVNLQKVREVITWTRNSYSLVLDVKPKSSIPLSKSKMVQLKEMLGLK